MKVSTTLSLQYREIYREKCGDKLMQLAGIRTNDNCGLNTLRLLDTNEKTHFT